MHVELFAHPEFSVVLSHRAAWPFSSQRYTTGQPDREYPSGYCGAAFAASCLTFESLLTISGCCLSSLAPTGVAEIPWHSAVQLGRRHLCSLMLGIVLRPLHGEASETENGPTEPRHSLLLLLIIAWR